MNFNSEAWTRVRTLLHRIVKWRRIVAGCTVLGLVLAIAFARFAGPQYSSYMIVSSVPNQTGTSAISAGISALGLGSAASALGISGGSGNQQFKNYLGLVQSDTVAQELLKSPANARLLFGDKITSDGHWKPSFRRRIKAAIFAVFGLPISDIPAPDETAKVINRHVIITTDSTNATDAKLRCTSDVPGKCVTLLNLVHRLSEEQLRKLTLQQSKEMVVYLNLAIARETQMETRTALAQMLATAEKQIAIASGNQPVAAVVVQPPIEPFAPDFPQPSMLVLLGMLFGFCAGAVIAWFKGNRR